MCVYVLLGSRNPPGLDAVFPEFRYIRCDLDTNCYSSSQLLAMVLTSFVVATLPMLLLMLLLALLQILLLLLLLPLLLLLLLLLFKSIASVILLRRFRYVPIIAACREICRKMSSFFQLLPTMRKAAKRTNPSARVSAGDDG
jgi:hypothetical protein